MRKAFSWAGQVVAVVVVLVVEEEALAEVWP